VVLTVDGTANVKLVDNAKTFTDVKSTNWYDDAVSFVSARGIMNGTGKDAFSPSVDLNRGMVAVILYNLENNPSQTFQASFTDVAAGKWYSDGIQWAANSGVIEGYGDGLYGPTDTLTREQLATILYRYAEVKGYDTKTNNSLSAFQDGSQTSSWAQEAMEWAVGTGLLSGKGNATLAPKESATRAQVAQIFMNFCANIVK
jgi:hypothetical protein